MEWEQRSQLLYGESNEKEIRGIRLNQLTL